MINLYEFWYYVREMRFTRTEISDREVSCRFASSLLRQGMKQIIINLETPEIIALEKEGEKDSIAKVKVYLL